MFLSLIVAMDSERGIGRNNDLMWHLPKDMRFFRKTTIGHIVIMGRKNYDSIPSKYRPLDQRENVILSRNKNFKAENCKVYHSLHEAVSSYQNETEKKIYYIIAWKLSNCGTCNISDVIESSGFSRSTVYKTIKKFELADLVLVKQSEGDKREFNLILAN